MNIQKKRILSCLSLVLFLWVVLSAKDKEFMIEQGEEKADMSTGVSLIGQVDFETYEAYKPLLTGFEEMTRTAYVYESDGANITLEQALDLCASILYIEGKSRIERVMEVDEHGVFVGYIFNPRKEEVGDDILWLENRLGVRSDNDGMKISIIMYENHQYEKYTESNHTVVTIDGYVFLADKLIVFEDW